ncbi:MULTISPECIES: hypothetical protein [Streptomyces]|uniref:Uncharacterized protein n=6 Tax=Streptomyces TaxID=1883 RepID=A0ABY4UQK8_STRFL|nr:MULTISPECIES: hypothetical protein [Streptomyces]MCC8482109.1 hypothetical protein [Streptomyces globisporus]MYV63092.1 hypothetical protein [Streptomyces sp. SID4931]OSC70102.1 hypothetical protein B5180_25585 [Streptomyces sp. BF-3]WDT89868.1 hypothetical protein H0E86_31090 [Streptomyces sp. SCSIO-PteL053]SCG06364.1 hypothetical protein GA0115255_121457 [Streptomyces sp. Ncost-T6T-2b]
MKKTVGWAQDGDDWTITVNGTQYRAIERPTGGRVDNYLVRGDDLSAECPSLGHGLGVIREHESRR